MFVLVSMKMNDWEEKEYEHHLSNVAVVVVVVVVLRHNHLSEDQMLVHLIRHNSHHQMTAIDCVYLSDDINKTGRDKREE